MEPITFKEVGNQTHFSCGCVTEAIGENFLIDPCSFKCEVYRYCIEQSKRQGNVISYQKIKPMLSPNMIKPEQEGSQ